MFELIFLIFTSIYFIQLLFFLIGALKQYDRLTEKELPTVSIIVAAKNEELNILNCMKSLSELDYPEGKLEIIIVNDHSTDNTQKIIDDFILNDDRFKTLIPQKEIGHLKGKANAIANGILISKNEIILTTDADCIVNKNWAKTIASYYTKNVAMVHGYTNQFENNLFGAMQSKDFLFLLGVAAGTMNMGKPLSCIGNNMSYRRDVYDEVGGYENIPFSVTEDFKLLMTVYSLKKYKIIYPIDKDALVTSAPCQDYKTLIAQKKRWGIGGLDSDWIGFSVMASGFMTNLGILLLPVIFSFNTLLISFFKLVADYMFLSVIHYKLNLSLKIKHFLIFEVYYILYVLALPFMVLINPKVKWKGREFKRNEE